MGLPKKSGEKTKTGKPQLVGAVGRAQAQHILVNNPNELGKIFSPASPGGNTNSDALVQFCETRTREISPTT